MTKNITLSIADDVASQMEAMTDVNWSAVARNCISQYIAIRKNPDMSLLLEKLQKEKGENYVDGRKVADAIAKNLGYSKLNVLMKKYEIKLNEVTEQEIRGPDEPWERLPSPKDIIHALLIENKLIGSEVSDAFLQGLLERLLEIDKALSQ